MDLTRTRAPEDQDARCSARCERAEAVRTYRGGARRGCHVDDHLVGIAVGHETRQRPSASHPVTARIVDDDEVYSTGFFAFGGNPGAGASTHDWFTRSDLCPKALQNGGARIIFGHWLNKGKRGKEKSTAFSIKAELGQIASFKHIHDIDYLLIYKILVPTNMHYGLV